MKSFFDRLLNALNIRGRDWVILILSLLLAFSVWLIHNLSFRYNAFLSVNVSAVSNLQGHSNVSADDAEVTARCRATGYKVIKGYLREGRTVKVNFDPSVFQHYADDRYYVTSDKLSEYSHLMFGDEVSVEYFVSDTLFFRFPAVNSKRVPVAPVTTLSFRDQYTNVGPLEMVPDSVTLYGEPFLLDKISSVSTSPINYSDITDDIHGIIRLEPIRGVRMSVAEAHYSMDVTRFADVTVDVPVEAVNVPSDKVLLIFPSTVKVLVRCEFPLIGDPYENLRLQVDYNDFVNSLTGKCMVAPKNLPRGIIGYEIDPVAVSCVEENR